MFLIQKKKESDTIENDSMFVFLYLNLIVL